MKLIPFFICLALIKVNGIYSQPRIKILFNATDASFIKAAQEYDSIWMREGEKIIARMEKISGMTFVDTSIVADIIEGPSYSGWFNKPMGLRASYPIDTKKGTLIHELGHRLHMCLTSYPENINDHELLFLYLYDVWTALYGEDFAKGQVIVESKRRNPNHDYKKMWEAALLMTKGERQEKLKNLLTQHKAR